MLSSISVEKRRRVAEALPSLYPISAKFTKRLIDKDLRLDFDEIHWRDDNRRRTIEAFVYFPKREKGYIINTISLLHGDSMYTIIAILEIIYFTSLFSDKKREELFLRLTQEMMALGTYSQDDLKSCELIRDYVIGFLRPSLQHAERVNHARDYFNKDDKYVSVFIAKNVMKICPDGKKCLKHHNVDCRNFSCAGYVFSLFDLCFKDNAHRNIRRPMAREDVVGCLLTLYSHGQFKEKAKKCILSLIEDGDDIISTTVFDYIHRIYEKGEIYTDLCKGMVTYAIEGSKNQILKERAIHVRETLGV